MLGCNSAQFLKALSLYATAAFVGIFCMLPPLLAATLPTYEAATGISVGPQAPTAIALDHRGRLYVVETGRHWLDVYDTYGQQINRLEGLNKPLSVAVTRRGQLYVGSKGDGSVTLYDSRTLKPLGKLGMGNGEFEKPTAITLDKNGRVYVADAKKGVVKIYTPQGALDFTFGSDGINSGQLRHPVSIVVNDYAEEILVLDFANGVVGRVQAFDLAGNFKRSFNTMGMNGLPLVRPIGMAMDNSQRLYVSDAYSSQVAAYDSEGNYLGGLSAAGAAMHNPLGMAYEASLGRLYIASLNNSHIVAFDLFDQRRNSRVLAAPPRNENQRSVDEAPSPSHQSPALMGSILGCRSRKHARRACKKRSNVAQSASDYTLQAVAGAHGRIEPAGNLQVAAGSDSRFQITPDPGYRVAGITLDGNPIGALAEYAVTNIRADHTLAVDFSAVLEVGQLQADHTWKRVVFRTPFTDPVVVAKPATHNDAEPAVVRIRNLDQSGFEVRLQEWDYLDDIHGKEKLSYLVIERGVHTLTDGVQIEAGQFDHATIHKYSPVTFKQAFSSKPIIVTSITSTHETDAVTGRMRNVSLEGFDYRLQEQELNRGPHAHEQVAYIAWTPSVGEVDGLLFEAAKASTGINHRFQPLAFSSSFMQTPAFIADMQTTAGGDTANLRIQQAKPQSIELQVDEEQSRDEETQHAREAIGYLTFGVSLANTDSDYDGDGLSDADEINTYGSSALAHDTDDDGLPDGEERRFWAEAWSLDHDGDGLINLLDSDADNDGHPDGAEYRAGSDPANTFSIPK